MKTVIAAIVLLTFYGSAVALASLVEIHSNPSQSARVEALKPDAQVLDASQFRAKDLVSHVRKEFNEAGCPALGKSEQCERLLTTFLELVRYAGPSGADGGVTIKDSTFYGNGK